MTFNLDTKDPIASTKDKEARVEWNRKWHKVLGEMHLLAGMHNSLEAVVAVLYDLGYLSTDPNPNVSAIGTPRIVNCLENLLLIANDDPELSDGHIRKSISTLREALANKGREVKVLVEKTDASDKPVERENSDPLPVEQIKRMERCRALASTLDKLERGIGRSAAIVAEVMDQLSSGKEVAEIDVSPNTGHDDAMARLEAIMGLSRRGFIAEPVSEIVAKYDDDGHMCKVSFKLTLHVRTGGPIARVPYRIDDKKISAAHSVDNDDYYSEERIAAMSAAIDEYKRYIGTYTDASSHLETESKQ